MKAKILYILIAFLFVSCVVPKNYSRAKEKVDRIINKFPEILQNDTIVVIDTIFVPEVTIDTLTLLEENDTIFIERERIKIRIIRLPGDTIQIYAECKTDTIIKTITVPVYTIEKHNLVKGRFLGVANWLWAVIVLSFIILLILIFRRRSRPSN